MVHDNAVLQGCTASTEVAEAIEEMKKRMQEIHKEIEERRDQRTQRNQAQAAERKEARFDVGDHVLRSRVDRKHQNKLWVT